LVALKGQCLECLQCQIMCLKFIIFSPRAEFPCTLLLTVYCFLPRFFGNRQLCKKIFCAACSLASILYLVRLVLANMFPARLRPNIPVCVFFFLFPFVALMVSSGLTSQHFFAASNHDRLTHELHLQGFVRNCHKEWPT